MADKKKLIIFCEYWGNGGIEKVISYINNNIDKSEYNSKIVSTIKNTQIYNDEVESISKYKIRNPIYRFIKTVFNIKKVTKEADIVHFNIHSSIGLIYAYLLRKSNAKIVIHAHNSNFDNNVIKLKTLISIIVKKLFCKDKFTYVACSKNAAEFCFDKKVNYTIIENEIDCNGFLYDENKRIIAREKYDIKPNDVVIGNIGRFQKQKNHKFLIDIFDEFLKLLPNSKLVLIGFGRESQRIRKQINEKNISNQVMIIKYCSNIDEMYQMFDFYVVPSKYEGYGITIFEALTSSLKCFVSDNVALNFEKDSNLIPISLNDSPKVWAEKIKSYIGYEREKRKSNLKESYINKIERIY